MYVRTCNEGVPGLDVVGLLYLQFISKLAIPAVRRKLKLGDISDVKAGGRQAAGHALFQFEFCVVFLLEQKSPHAEAVPGRWVVGQVVLAMFI